MVAPPQIPAGAPRLQPVRLPWSGRLLSAGVAAACLLVLGLAAWVRPSQSGSGTHLQLSLPPCGFLDRTSIPCGTCGMTTSFAHFARGNLAASFYVQPFGAVLAMTTAVGFWVAAYVALTGRPAYRVLRRLPARWVAGTILGLWVLAWGWKILLVMRQADGW